MASPLPRPTFIPEAANAFDESDHFEYTATDTGEMESQFPQLGGQFFVDRAGMVRWANIEGAQEGLAGIGKFPTDQELLRHRPGRRTVA